MCHETPSFGATAWHAACIDIFSATMRSSTRRTTRSFASWSNFLGMFQIFPSTQTEQNLGHFNIFIQDIFITVYTNQDPNMRTAGNTALNSTIPAIHGLRSAIPSAPALSPRTKHTGQWYKSVSCKRKPPITARSRLTEISPIAIFALVFLILPSKYFGLTFLSFVYQ